MPNSLYVPLDQLPDTLAELQSIVGAPLAEFGLPPASVAFDREGADATLLQAFAQVSGERLEHACWLSFTEQAGGREVSEGRPFMVGVQTRDSWTFAGIVALGLCRYAGSLVFDDAGVLGESESYSADALHAALTTLSAKDQSHQTRRAACDLALDQDLDACGVVDAEIFDLLDLSYWYDSAATVGWVEQRLRVLAARLDRGEGLSLLDPATGLQVEVADRAQFKEWVERHFPVLGKLVREE
ncbi:hypothetical protein [Ralstonia mojiangensis]|uniref:hypothetical protein n=1 Tax=Ralstonia mojiangensis TaxID=2953895 RepID=UPI0020912B42|nr:hypothetical protein [Ralstonia mojiangensis]MCO5410786.1 hypothetical protein [Ralstonia mojiangensis]